LLKLPGFRRGPAVSVAGCSVQLEGRAGSEPEGKPAGADLRFGKRPSGHVIVHEAHSVMETPCQPRSGPCNGIVLQDTRARGGARETALDRRPAAFSLQTYSRAAPATAGLTTCPSDASVTVGPREHTARDLDHQWWFSKQGGVMKDNAAARCDFLHPYCPSRLCLREREQPRADGHPSSARRHQGSDRTNQVRRGLSGPLSELNGKFKLTVTELTLDPGGYVGEHNHVGPGIRQFTWQYPLRLSRIH
jgi:hypothetical protein